MHLVKGYTGDSDVEKSEDHSTAHTEPRESLKNHIQVLFPWSSKPKSWYTTVVNSGMAITIDCGASQVALVVMTVPAGGDRGSIPRSGRSPREGNGDPLQYSSLGKPTDRGACGLWSTGLQRVKHNWVYTQTHTHTHTHLPWYPVASVTSKSEKRCFMCCEHAMWFIETPETGKSPTISSPPWILRANWSFYVL